MQELQKPILIKDLGYTYKKYNRYGIFECPICKKHYITQTSAVKNGKSTKCRSCATKTQTSMIKRNHGFSEDRLYCIWANMKARCNYDKSEYYNVYGGRGIKVCNEWNNFLPFREWALQNGYKENLTIDRINNDGNYEHSNCQWITNEDNCRKTRRLNSKNTSEYRGVYFNKKANKWQSYITVSRQNIYLGLFKDKKEAALKRDEYIIEHNLLHTKNF